MQTSFYSAGPKKSNFSPNCAICVSKTSEITLFMIGQQLRFYDLVIRATRGQCRTEKRGLPAVVEGPPSVSMGPPTSLDKLDAGPTHIFLLFFLLDVVKIDIYSLKENRSASH